MDGSPIQKLVTAMMLSSIKKGARVIRIVANDPIRVFFDFGSLCQEEMRPPGKLRGPMIALLCEMSGATAYSPGHVTLLVKNVQYDWHATLRRNTFRLERVA